MTGVKGRRWPANIYVDDSIDDYAIPYKGPGGVLLWLSPGAANQVVASSGTSGPIGYADQSGGSGGGGSGSLVLLESHIASASASLDFTTRNASGQSGATFQSDYDEYLVEMVNLIPANNSVQFYLRMSTNGGSSYDATSGNYSWDDLRIGPGGAAAGGSPTSQTAIVITGGSNVETIKNTAADGGLNGQFRIFNPLSTTAHKHISGQTVFQSGNNVTYVIGIIGGKYISTTAVNAFRILASSGNIASGVGRLYGIAK